jgi:hypothetical protein
MLRGYVGRATPPSYETHRMEQTGYASDTYTRNGSDDTLHELRRSYLCHPGQTRPADRRHWYKTSTRLVQKMTTANPRVEAQEEAGLLIVASLQVVAALGARRVSRAPTPRERDRLLALAGACVG